MEATVTCLLVSALLLQLGADADATENTTASLPMQCFFCYEPTEVLNCNEVKTCSPDITGCKTVVLGSNTGYPYADSNVKVTRDCARTCFKSDPEELGQETQTICCTGTLCNQLFELMVGLGNNSSPALQTACYHGLVIMAISLLGILLPSWLG
ncbi:secreted Ly-6/uPAR-related protein 1-like [Hyperolius riggenbachi]|uniref:secreted Ly-6/uPAR-related protein 1-like n=1 Tax=Hyperolius riggenbachi TaxID=752182 RepID=UPI0035A2EB8F